MNKQKQTKRRAVLYEMRLMSADEIRQAGHYIELGVKLDNPFFKGRDSDPFLLALGIPNYVWSEICEYKSYLVNDSTLDVLKPGAYLSPIEVIKMRIKYGNAFTAESGAAAALPILKRFDVDAYVTSIERDRKNLGERPRDPFKKAMRERLQFLAKNQQNFVDLGCQLEWRLLEVLPVVDEPQMEPFYRQIRTLAEKLQSYKELNAPNSLICKTQFQMQTELAKVTHIFSQLLGQDSERLRDHAPGFAIQSEFQTEPTLLVKYACGVGIKLLSRKGDGSEKLG